jgi:hypothetical protein
MLVSILLHKFLLIFKKPIVEHLFTFVNELKNGEMDGAEPRPVWMCHITWSIYRVYQPSLYSGSVQ